MTRGNQAVSEETHGHPHFAGRLFHITAEEEDSQFEIYELYDEIPLLYLNVVPTREHESIP